MLAPAPEQEPAFPIHTEKEVYYFDNTPQLQEGVISHYKLGGIIGSDLNRFLLLKTIAGLHYQFILAEVSGNTFGLSFKTEEYEFATTNLEEASRAELFSCIKAFIESVQHVMPITEIAISAAAASYSSEEIDRCTDAILASPKNTLSRKELAQRYKGFQMFDLYSELFDKAFLPVHYTSVSKALARARLFKAMIQKGFPGWEIQEESFLRGDFRLKRKVSEDGNQPKVDKI